MLDLAAPPDTLPTPLRELDFSYMYEGAGELDLWISGRAFQRPGWVLVSTVDTSAASHTWMDDRVFALELKATSYDAPDAPVVRLAHTHSVKEPPSPSGDENPSNYWAEPHGSVNPTFTKVILTSNWGRVGTDETECFLVELPEDWPNHLS